MKKKKKFKWPATRGLFEGKKKAQQKRAKRGYRTVQAIDKPTRWEVPKTKKFNGLLYHLSEESHITQGGALKELKKVREKGHHARVVEALATEGPFGTSLAFPWRLYIRKRK